MSRTKPSKDRAYGFNRDLEAETIKLRFELQRAKDDANRQYRRAAQFEELLTQARQEIAASRSVMDYQQANARRNGAGR